MTNEELLKVIDEAKASNVNALDLSNSGITELPPEFFQLTSLTSLNLSWNQLTKLPPEVGQLTNLKDVDLWNNQLTGLPQEFAKLTKLDMLNLGGNRLTTLPPEIYKLTNLTRLRLGENQLTALPPEIGQLTELRELTLFKNHLTTLPSEICQLKKLTILNLNSNQLTPMPLEICELTGLKELHLSFNQLTTLPPKICQLNSLTHLNLNGTQLTKLPSEFFSLTSLTWLNLSVNKLAPLPSQIGQLTGLKGLNLSWNKLTTLPPEICQLTNLTNLDLWGNQLTPLPLEICKLPTLRELNLGHNQLTKLPPDICQLTQLKTLRLDDNPLTSPSWEVAIKGIEAIRQYFVDLEKGKQPLNEVKIILVGEGGAGKTSLVKQLLGQQFDKNEETTHGINILGWEQKVGGRKIKVNIWDFGGQQIQHATHQFFLSKRSLYILVLDGRKDERAEYWLRHIEAFGGESPVLVVLNKQDANPLFDVNRPFLQEKYPSIKEFFPTSCESRKGIPQFKEALLAELAKLEMLKTVWPGTWFKVKQRIEQREKSYISYQDYKHYCEDAGITDEKSHETLADFLHDLGVAVHFKDFILDAMHVLNPVWVTNAVYAVITDEKMMDTKGILHLKHLGEILPHDNGENFFCPPETHPFIMRLMQKFELCYPVDEDAVLIPQLLPVLEPTFAFERDGSLRFALHYPDFLPPSVFPRFMVKMYKDIEDNLRWRTGVVLEDKQRGVRAVIKADIEARRISIWVQGEYRRDYLHHLRYSLADINSSFEKLKIMELVPMPDAENITADYATLLEYAKNSIDKYIPTGAAKVYSVHELLGLVQPDKEDKQIELLRMILERLDDKESPAEVLNRLVKLEPSIFGVGFNLNEAFKLILAWDKRRQQQASRCPLPSSIPPAALETKGSVRSSHLKRIGELS